MVGEDLQPLLPKHLDQTSADKHLNTKSTSHSQSSATHIQRLSLRKNKLTRIKATIRQITRRQRYNKRISNPAAELNKDDFGKDGMDGLEDPFAEIFAALVVKKAGEGREEHDNMGGNEGRATELAGEYQEVNYVCEDFSHLDNEARARLFTLTEPPPVHRVWPDNILWEFRPRRPRLWIRDDSDDGQDSLPQVTEQ